MGQQEIIGRKWIFLPVEVKSRELISKLFFADLATRRGYGVILGRNGMNISRDHFPRGLYFDKSQLPHQLKTHKYQVETLGNLLVTLDEEALIVDETHAEGRFNQGSIDLSSIIFAWGDEEAAMINKKYETQDKVLVVGSPRVDCWIPENDYIFAKEIGHIRQRFGNFILINSNFGAPVLPENRYTDADRRHFELTTVIRKNFMMLMTKIAETFTDRHIVLRPHPGEEQGLWESLRLGLPSNAHIILDGPVSPWIRASSLLLHHCCTTAVEAWVAQVPSISYEPDLEGYPNYRPFHGLPSALSTRLNTQESVIDAIKNGIASQTLPRIEQQKILSDYLEFDENELSSSKILRAIDKLSLAADDYSIPEFTNWKKVRGWVGRLKYRLGDVFDVNKIPLRYHLQKNPRMDLAEIEDWVARLTFGDADDENGLQVHQVDVDTFCLFR